MSSNRFSTYETAWCPGCGDFAILDSVKKTLEELGKDPYEVLMVGGIGQAAKLPQYISANAFCGLHGRALPAAIGAKMANEELTVIVTSGDGDSYGEGGNHFLHNIRRNVDITHFVHDNQVYGLTKGQSSPTSIEGFTSGVQVDGNIAKPLNPLMVAIAAGAGFVARAYSAKKDHLVSIMKQAIEYEGYALVDILQPCVSFNKINTYEYYNNRVYELDDSYDETDKLGAMEKSMEFDDKIPLGVIYREDTVPFHKKNQVLKSGEPLVDRELHSDKFNNILKEFI